MQFNNFIIKNIRFYIFFISQIILKLYCILYIFFSFSKEIFFTYLNFVKKRDFLKYIKLIIYILIMKKRK